VNRLFFLLLSILVFTECGDVGIALNISREQPVSIGFSETIDSVLLIMDQQVDFSLDDVDAFGEYLPKLNELGSFSFNHFAYAIDSISPEEASIAIDLFEIKMINGEDTLQIVRELDQTLADRNKAVVPISDQDIATITQWLFDRETITTDLHFELSNFPSGLNELDFEFTCFFDATLKARNISP
jgi:hypothetical protein